MQGASLLRKTKAEFEASKQASLETIQRLDGNIFELDSQIFELQAYLEEMEIILNMEKERAENGAKTAKSDEVKVVEEQQKQNQVPLIYGRITAIMQAVQHLEKTRQYPSTKQTTKQSPNKK